VFRFQVIKATVEFRLTRENPEGYHAVCEEPIDLGLRRESRKLDPQKNYEESF
jgi:hypothetical protein